MLQHRFDMTTATPVDMIAAQIIDGLAACKSVHDIAAEIAATLVDKDDVDCKPQ